MPSSLHLYNTRSRKDEKFVPLKEGVVTMYTCGPTVYGRPHIGNYSSFLLADLLRRWLEVSGYEVIHAKNITDVGHLVADADHGEDKIERQAKAEQLDPLAIAEKYTRQYLEDEKALGLLEPAYRPKATETIHQQLDAVKLLLEKGHAYETSDGIYYSVESFPSYGELSGNTLEQLNAGARIAVDEEKKHPADFALWKKCTGDNAQHLLRWSYDTGERVHTVEEDPSVGFPGWHIECSVMSRMFLGDQIDIHTGGEDLIFPHHECEIAQSEGCTGKQSVNYWLHRRFIDMGEEKMSKSKGNVLSLDDITSMGFDPLDLRYYLLSVHYRTNLKFTKEGIEGAKKARSRVIEWMTAAKEWSAGEGESGIDQWQQKFEDAMNSDLNTPEALGVVFELMAHSRSNKENLSSEDVQQLRALIADIQHTFGCFDPEEQGELPLEVQTLVDQRSEARKSKDFDASDRLRDAIVDLGYSVRDTADGQEIRKK